MVSFDARQSQINSRSTHSAVNPNVCSTALALILRELQATTHCVLTCLIAESIDGRATHGTAHVPSSQQRHRRGLMDPRLCDSRRLCASLPGV